MANCLRLACLLFLFGLVSIEASESDDLEPLEPILCPNDDPLTHTCYELIKENRSCIVVTFDTCNDIETDRHWWVYSLCIYVKRDNCTTAYKCNKTCCDGWTTDSDGRCDKPVDDNDITCENGLVNWDEDKPKCECFPNFYGERCEIPRCEGGCKNGGVCREQEDETHQCHCPPPFTGPNCETVTCLEPCENGGSCVSNGAEAVCSCPLNYYGKTCAHKIDGSLCPLPNNTDCRMWNCRDECINSAGCQEGYVCCSDGCKMRCVRPVTKTCRLGDKFYRAGEMFSKDACNHCTCLVNGTVSCSKIECPVLDCVEGDLAYEADMCCPVCKRSGDLPIEHEAPTLSRCYQGVVVPLNLSRNSNTYYLRNLNIEAWDYTGSKIQVTYSPSTLTHCGCDDRQPEMVSVSAVDRYGSRTECNFWAYLLDPVSPTFLSCPVEIYAYEDEQIKWDEPRALDNVGIHYLWSNIDQGDPLGPGDHTVTYTAVDYDGNQATCEFNVYVYRRDGTSNAHMPAGLRCRKRKTHTAGLVAGIVCGTVALAILITVAVLVTRVRRRRCVQRQRHQHERTLAVSNENYGDGLFPDYKGSSTKPPGYTPPTNPPAYDEVDNPGGQDYKFANPPLYDELSLAGGDMSESNPQPTDNWNAGNGVYEEAGREEVASEPVSNPTYGPAIAGSIRALKQSDV